MNKLKSTVAALLCLGMAISAAGSAGAVTVTGGFLADSTTGPLASSGCAAGGNFNCATTPLSIGDAFSTEIDGNLVDSGGSFTFWFTATENLSAVETNTLNPLTGFLNAFVQWNTQPNGGGTTLASLTAAQIALNQAMQVPFLAGQTLYLIASWTDVTENASNFDLRVSAVPIPPAILLFLSALAGVGWLGRCKSRVRPA